MFEETEDSPEYRMLFRVGSWGAAAVVALVLAVVSLRSEIGVQRLAQASASTPAGGKVTAAELAAITAQRETDARQTVESLRSLAADRDRLLARLAALERNLEDVTGSVGRIGAARQRDETAQSIAALMNSGPTLASAVAAPLISAPQTRPAARTPSQHVFDRPQPPASDSVVTHTLFGVDLGGGGNLGAVRALWATAVASNAAALKGLIAVVGIRDGRSPGSIDLRLIAGPLQNASAAARLCATLSSAGTSCRPTVFDGQRLTVQ